METTRYDELRTLVAANFSETTQRLVDEALAYAAECLEKQVRYDGSPLLDHAAGVARIVISEIGLGRNSTLAAILHDVVRLAACGEAGDLMGVTSEIRRRFGDEVLGITVGLSNISKIRLKVSKEQAANFRDLIVSYSEDPRVILIKLADRLEVMRNLRMFPREKWRKKSWESMNLYAQIAHKLGLYSIKSELEDIALSYLEPAEYEHIHRKLEETERERQTFIDRFLAPIVERLDRQGFNYHVKSRTKSIFSIWTKMHKQHVPFEGVYDIFALRIILDCPPEEEKTQCWAVYSIVTDYYIPNTERLRDWISIPKSNGYESLHTTVFGRRRPLGGDSDPHRADGCRGRTRHRGALALQGGQPGGAHERDVARPPARVDGEYAPCAGAAVRFAAVVGRNLRLHAQRRPAQAPRRGYGTRLRLRHPLQSGMQLFGRQDQRPRRADQGDAP